MEAAVVQIIAAGLRALADGWPSILKAFTGGQTAEEAIEAARKAAKALPQFTGPGGTWAAEDDAQDERIRAEDTTEPSS